eukprot:9383715-Ditylum_brightwellii.AAC.1
MQQHRSKGAEGGQKTVVRFKWVVPKGNTIFNASAALMTILRVTNQVENKLYIQGAIDNDVWKEVMKIPKEKQSWILLMQNKTTQEEAMLG